MSQPEKTARDIIAALLDLLDAKWLQIVWLNGDKAVVERARAYLAKTRP